VVTECKKEADVPRLLPPPSNLEKGNAMDRYEIDG
jgi:hypothetical protein